MSKKVFLVDLEAVDTRYTGEWKVHLPELLRKHGIDVVVIEGPSDIPAATTPGAFLNFGGTNVYKAAQVERFSRLFCDGSVHDGDYFLFTDAWHPGIINLKYMSELLGIKIKIGALWHAGSYDPADFLGRLIGNRAWVRHSEKAFYSAIDHNFFATEFHVRLFMEELLNDGLISENPWFAEDWNERYQSGKIVRTGWPMEYMHDILQPYKGAKKRDLILFPHRIAPEKQVNIFKDLAMHMPNYEFIVCQEEHRTKHEYHTLLGEAKMVFSASLQETLGIGCFEGAVLGAFPLVPNRLSYKEMYSDQFKYPSEWTQDFEYYTEHKSELIDKIDSIMLQYNNWQPDLNSLANRLQEVFFSCDKIIDKIKDNND